MINIRIKDNKKLRHFKLISLIYNNFKEYQLKLKFGEFLNKIFTC